MPYVGTTTVIEVPVIDLVAEHSGQVDFLAEQLQNEASAIAEVVLEDMVGHLNRSIKLVDGEVVRSGQNAAAILSMPSIFDQAVRRSGYHDLMTGFALDLQRQAEHFKVIYTEDAGKLGLPAFTLSSEDREMLLDQSGATLSAMESTVVAVKASLIKLVGRSIAQPSMTDLFTDVGSIVRRMGQVKSMAIEQEMLFFRFLATTTYSVAERSTGRLHYEYVGPKDRKNSELCANLLDGDVRFTSDEFRSMKNEDDRTVGIFGGHYACVHWFRAVGRAA